MSIEDNKAMVRRVFEEVTNQGQVALINELFAPNFLYHNPTRPDVRTRENLKRLVTELRSAFTDLYFMIEDMIAEGEQVVAQPGRTRSRRLLGDAAHRAEAVSNGAEADPGRT